MSPSGAAFSVAFPNELVESIAERAVELLADRAGPTTAELLTVDEAAELLRCKRQRIYDLVSQRRLPCLKDGSRVLLRRTELLAYLDGTHS